ncbi:hypothetical protein UPYG_G00301120 [Umbra pygmaea]|uniref:Uncharacterized protein n=1 Tax=Umbra pygmaea TaxID=75934 RepID=A0ABD0WAN2_UMBPY
MAAFRLTLESIYFARGGNMGRAVNHARNDETRLKLETESQGDKRPCRKPYPYSASGEVNRLQSQANCSHYTFFRTAKKQKKRLQWRTQIFVPPLPAQEYAELLPESWRAALNKEQQQWIGRQPGTSRLVEAICSQLCRLNPCGTQSGGIKRSRWALVLADYVSIREAVLESPRMMAETNIELFELSQRTISQWYSRRQKERERSVLEQGLGLIRGPSVTPDPFPEGRQPHYRAPDLQPFVCLSRI